MNPIGPHKFTIPDIFQMVSKRQTKTTWFYCHTNRSNKQFLSLSITFFLVIVFLQYFELKLFGTKFSTTLFLVDHNEDRVNYTVFERFGWRVHAPFLLNPKDINFLKLLITITIRECGTNFTHSNGCTPRHLWPHIRILES